MDSIALAVILAVIFCWIILGKSDPGDMGDSSMI
jgi:hypothetical protein